MNDCHERDQRPDRGRSTEVLVHCWLVLTSVLLLKFLTRSGPAPSCGALSLVLHDPRDLRSVSSRVAVGPGRERRAGEMVNWCPPSEVVRRSVVVFTHTYGKRAVNRKSLTPPYMHSTSCAVPVELQTLFGTACSKEPKSTVWTPGAPSTRLRRGTQRRPTRPRRQRHWRRRCPRAHSGANRRPAAPCRSRVSGIAAIAPCEDERGRPHGTGHGVGRRDEATSCSFAYTA